LNVTWEQVQQAVKENGAHHQLKSARASAATGFVNKKSRNIDISSIVPEPGQMSGKITLADEDSGDDGGEQFHLTPPKAIKGTYTRRAAQDVTPTKGHKRSIELTSPLAAKTAKYDEFSSPGSRKSPRLTSGTAHSVEHVASRMLSRYNTVDANSRSSFLSS